MKAALIFWTILILKWIQKNILDKILHFTLQFSTLQGSQYLEMKDITMNLRLNM